MDMFHSNRVAMKKAIRPTRKTHIMSDFSDQISIIDILLGTLFACIGLIIEFEKFRRARVAEKLPVVRAGPVIFGSPSHNKVRGLPGSYDRSDQIESSRFTS